MLEKLSMQSLPVLPLCGAWWSPKDWGPVCTSLCSTYCTLQKWLQERIVHCVQTLRWLMTRRSFVAQDTDWVHNNTEILSTIFLLHYSAQQASTHSDNYFARVRLQHVYKHVYVPQHAQVASVFEDEYSKDRWRFDFTASRSQMDHRPHTV